MSMVMKTMQDLEARYAESVNRAKVEYDWYAKHRWGYYWTSLVLRFGAVVFLAIGAVLPFVHFDPQAGYRLIGVPFEHPAQAAVACLVIAAILLAVNEVFMVTSTWTRYVGAMMKIRALMEVADWDWQVFRDTVSEPLTSDDTKRATEICKTLALGARQVVEAETAAWTVELARAVDQLQSLIREQRTASLELEAKQQQAREAAERARGMVAVGALRVRVDGATERLVSERLVCVGEQRQPGTAFPGHVIVNDVQAGLQKVTVTAKDERGKEVIAENAVVTAAGTVTDVTITIPSK